MSAHAGSHRGVHAFRSRLLDLHIGRRVADEHLDFLDVCRLRAGEFLPSITQRHVRTASRQRDGGLQRRIAAAHDERVLAGKFFRIEKAIVDLVELFARTTELAEVSAASDGDDNAPRRQCRFVALMQKQRFPAAARLKPLDSRRRDIDPGRLPLRFHFFQERFLHVGGKLEAALEFHLGRIGVDRFCFREINDRGKNFRRFEDGKVQLCFLRFNGRRDASHARPDDGKIEHSGFILHPSAFNLSKIRLAQNSANGLRAGMRRKLEERNAGEITDDSHAGLRRNSLRAGDGKFFHGARGPLRVEPFRVTFDYPGHRSASWKLATF